MNNLINYTFNKSTVRVVTDDKGEPLFCLADVCKVLNFTNTTNVVNQIKEEYKCPMFNIGHLKDSLGREQECTLITESQLYFVMMRSRSEIAREFRQWICNEVLPSIRKTGGYHVPQTFSEALIAYAKEVELREKLEKENKAMLPKAEFYDTVANSESYLSMNDVAKILNMGVGRNTIFKILRQEKILMQDNQPYQEYVNRGYFKVIEGHYMVGDNAVITKTTYVQQKGVDYIRKLLKSRNVEYK